MRENSSSIMDLELSIFWQENQKNIDYQNLQITLLEFILVWMQIYHLVRLNSIKDIPTLVAFNKTSNKRISHEKHTEVYTEESINYFEKVDHGVLDVCTTTQTITGAVSGNATGCIVSVNGTASIAPGQSFRTARGINAATKFIDNGDVAKTAAPLHDYGHILITSNIMPNGLFKFRTDTGATDKFTPNWNGSGVIKVYNQIRYYQLTLLNLVLEQLEHLVVLQKLLLLQNQLKDCSKLAEIQQLLLLYYTLDLVHSRNFLVLQNLLLSTQKKDNYYSLSLELSQRDIPRPCWRRCSIHTSNCC